MEARPEEPEYQRQKIKAEKKPIILAVVIILLLVVYFLIYSSPKLCATFIQREGYSVNKTNNGEFTKSRKMMNVAAFSLGMVGLSLPPKRNLEYSKMIHDSAGEIAKYQGKSHKSMLCKCLYLNGRYEPKMDHYFKQTLKKGDVVIDVGANEGYFTMLAAKLVGPSGKVYTVEPSKSNLQLLENNIQVNKLENVQILPVAAGLKNGDLQYTECKFNGMWNGFSKDATEVLKLCSKIPFATKQTTIPVRILNDLIQEDPQRIKLIKIDTEGSEKEVVTGLSKFIHPDSTTDWIIEMVPAEQSSMIHKFMVECGYNAYMWEVDSVAVFNLPGNIQFYPLNEQETRMKNVLFTKKSL